MAEFLGRLKQRRLVQWMLAYVAAAFALIQVLDVIVQRFGWPDLVEKLLILALALGFFVTLVLAWYHGERGAQKVGGAELLIIALLLAIGGGALWWYARTPQAANGNANVVQRSEGVRVAPNLVVRARARNAASVAASPARIPEASVAVLPFANESGDKEQQFFSDGLSEDLINALSQFAGLKVISRNSAFQFRDSKDDSAEIGRKLGVAHLLEGSVRRSDNEVRISAELVQASDGTILWSQHYDRPYKGLFKLQDDITQSVADALKAKLTTANGSVLQSDRPPSGDLDAYIAYQHGAAYLARDTATSLRKAITAFGEATRRDPHYAVAYAQLSRSLRALAGQFLGGQQAAQTNARARAAADTALALDPESSRAHQARALLLTSVDMDWRGAEAEARRAVQLAPGDALAKFHLGIVLATLGQARRAAELTRQALDSDPRHAVWYLWLSHFLAGLGQLDDAQQAINAAIALQPGVAASHEQLGIVEILRGNAKAALAAAQQEPPGVWHAIGMALALQIGSDHAAADRALQALVAKYADTAPYQIAEVYALRKDPGAMFHWLDRAWNSRDPGINHLLYDPLILRYQHDPRFAAYCKKVGLPATTDAVAMPL